MSRACHSPLSSLTRSFPPHLIDRHRLKEIAEHGFAFDPHQEIEHVMGNTHAAAAGGAASDLRYGLLAIVGGVSAGVMKGHVRQQ
ncbi:hypothetical protein [Bradyrhizobium sp. CB3481]|uniref:hypothetical protein n=1 Tax=Bradyrhizobium sp. CB3481 TaxID=3039158 RepID=UPI0032C21EB3